MADDIEEVPGTVAPANTGAPVEDADAKAQADVDAKAQADADAKAQADADAKAQADADAKAQADADAKAQADADAKAQADADAKAQADADAKAQADADAKAQADADAKAQADADAKAQADADAKAQADADAKAQADADAKAQADADAKAQADPNATTPAAADKTDDIPLAPTAKIDANASEAETKFEKGPIWIRADLNPDDAKKSTQILHVSSIPAGYDQKVPMSQYVNANDGTVDYKFEDAPMPKDFTYSLEIINEDGTQQEIFKDMLYGDLK